MVCESNRVVVYDKQLRFSREIICDGLKGVYNLSSNENSSISQSGYTFIYTIVPSHMCVFRKDYHSNTKFEKSWERELKSPWGIHVVGDFIYVTNQGSRDVAVFTTGGQYVTSFGENLNSPCGVCVDKFGFVYVCDKDNKIVVY